MNNTCRICGVAREHPTWLLRERMFGLGDPFTYFQCLDCGCLQIVSPPADWTRYYPATYYSLNSKPVPQTGLKSRAAGWRDRALAAGRNNWWTWLNKPKACHPHLSALGRVPLRRDMRILDVGCGRGELLSVLHRAGFSRLAGIDPFLASDHEVIPGLRVRKLALEKTSGEFELIMLHHVLEHVEPQAAMLEACRERLAPGGRILVRIPIIDCAVWERYREKSAQLDAPRHLILHSYRSLARVVSRAGLKLENCWCDSTGFQLWASELYRMDVPLVNRDGSPTDPSVYFSPEQMNEFAREAKRLNDANRGDQVAAILS